MLRTLSLQVLVAVLVVTLALLVYQLAIARVRQPIATVDVVAVYAAKEKEFAALLTKAGATEEDRRRAAAMAAEFAKSLPAALGQLPGECRCMVLVKGAVAAPSADTLDLTAVLADKLGLRL
jgi:hypothetical protein